MESESFDLCCLLWAREGAESALTDYEDRVLALLSDHGIELVARAIGDGAAGRPIETHLYRVPRREALDAYIDDPRRAEMAEERDRVISRTELFPVSLR
ncbi:hypothetical protein [Microbacterium sp.]|uniref:hypothetical protein n=1 Tax=Microbacterium sp. TaxID=51671 RepID=UPI003F6E7A41